MRHFPDGRVYHGHDGVREAFRRWLGTWEDYHQERGEAIDAGDEVVVPVREHGRGKGSGIEMERHTFGVWTLRDGKAVRIRFYPTRSEALKAVGLEE
jgi:ketosteroid isomerase-like protein